MPPRQQKKTGLRTEFLPEKDPENINKSLLSLDVGALEANVMQNERVIFSRFLGHREIEDSHKWCYRRECWICEGWKYTLFVWSLPLAESSDLF